MVVWDFPTAPQPQPLRQSPRPSFLVMITHLLIVPRALGLSLHPPSLILHCYCPPGSSLQCVKSYQAPPRAFPMLAFGFGHVSSEFLDK